MEDSPKPRDGNAAMTAHTAGAAVLDRSPLEIDYVFGDEERACGRHPAAP
jgi:hypothetical protein